MILAVGANKPGTLKLEEGETVNALKFLADFKEKNGKVDLGRNVVVVGGGNTAMDTARAAKRTEGVENVYLENSSAGRWSWARWTHPEEPA